MTLFVRFQVLLLSALLAHVVAGGTFVETPNFIWQGVGLGAILFGIRGIKLEGPCLALLILFIQSSSHFVLGGNTYQNESRMTFAHLLSGFVSYFAISYFDIVWDLIASILIALVPTKIFLTLSLPEPFGHTAAESIPNFQISQLTASLKFRGPPFAWEN